MHATPLAIYNQIPVTGSQLPTNQTTNKHKIHRWFNFIAGFSPEFVHQCISGADLNTESLLLDPFSGCGTSLVCACERGIKAIGFDPHPIFTRIARAKLPSINATLLLSDIEIEILKGLNQASSGCLLGLTPTSGAFLNKLFEPNTLQRLLSARKALETGCLANNDLAFLILSSIVEKASHSQTDGIYKAPTSKKRSVDPVEACHEIISQVAHDLNYMGDTPFSNMAVVYDASSESMTQVPDSTVDIIVTSPPYLNNFDFAEMTRMLLYFWGIAGSWGEITDRVRSHLMVNTTSALKGHREKQGQYRQTIPNEFQSELDTLVMKLRLCRNSRPGKKDYDLLVFPYFSQMLSVLKECFRTMKASASMHIMVADAALYGVHIPAPQIITSMIQYIGFRDVSCTLVRHRGHRWMLNKRQGSPEGLGEYHVTAYK